MTTHYEPDSPDPLAPARGCASALVYGLALWVVIFFVVAVIGWVVR